MSFVYTYAKAKLMSGDIDLNTDDIRVLLVLSGTTADTEEDVEFLAGFTTLDEVVDASYARKTLTTEAVNADLANDRGEFTADNITWAALTSGGSVVGMIVYKHVGADGVNIPIAYIDSGGFPVTMTGGNLAVTWNAEGILQAT